MGQKTTESIFTYSLTRKYPFRWFTYVVFFGLAICAILFSFVALAADGYDFDLQYTLQLNKTLNHPYWFQKGPLSWISKSAVSCQPALLTTGSTYFTSNLGLMYTLDRLWVEGATGTQEKNLPAVAYEHTVLKDCEVRKIEIDFMRRDQAQGGDTWSWGLTTASATVTCTIQAPTFGVRANLTTNLPYLYQATDINGDRSFGLSVNVSQHANLWFGAQFANAWYRQLSVALSYSKSPFGVTPGVVDIWNSGTAIMTRNPAVDDYTDLDFFYIWSNFVTLTGEVYPLRPPSTFANATDGFLPNATTTIDTFGKSLYSLLLCDFGVVDKTNALITPAGVNYLESRVDHHLRANSAGTDSPQSGRPENVTNAVHKYGPSYPINESYALVVDALGAPPNLNTTTFSTIFTQYLCSIPTQKGPGALFFAVLLADIVFLQAVWTLLNMAATWWMERKYKDANYCDGCRLPGNLVAEPKRMSYGSEYQLLPVVSVGSSIMTEQDPGRERIDGPAAGTQFV